MVKMRVCIIYKKQMIQIRNKKYKKKNLKKNRIVQIKFKKVKAHYNQFSF